MSESILILAKKPWVWLYAFGWIAIWIWLATLGFPGPRLLDDVFYGGAAVHWAKTGVLENPWISDWLKVNGLLDHRFYIYPPLHFLVLGAWARVFGISALSFQAFQICSLASSSLLAAVFFLRTETRLLALAAPVVLTAYLWDVGVRSETTAVVLLLGGCVLLLWRSRSAWFGSGLLLAATCCASPVLGLYAIAIVLMMIYVLYSSLRPVEHLASRQSCYYFFAGFLVVSLIFVAALNRELLPFLRDFLHYRNLSTTTNTVSGNAYSYAFMLSFGVQWLKIPLITTAVLLPIIASLRKQDGAIGGISNWLCWALLLGSSAIVLSSVCSGHRLPTIELVSFPIIGLSLSNRTFRARRQAIQLLVCLMIIAAIPMVPLEAFTHNRPDKAEVARVLEELSNTPHEKIFADDYAVWWLFDWNPPADFSSYRLSYHHDEKKPPTSLKDGEIWIIQESEIHPQPLRLFGRTFRSQPVNRNVFLILDASSEKNYTR